MEGEKTGLSNWRRRAKWRGWIKDADLDKSNKRGRSILARMIWHSRKKAQKLKR